MTKRVIARIHRAIVVSDVGAVLTGSEGGGNKPQHQIDIGALAQQHGEFVFLNGR
ncbi:MAG: hypothetical protein PHD43_08540 [Methylococcales bacterium]|nr:hypothetical protein [Methylococcales bacterium]